MRKSNASVDIGITQRHIDDATLQYRSDQPCHVFMVEPGAGRSDGDPDEDEPVCALQSADGRHAPLNARTRFMIDLPTLDAHEALGHLAGAGLDVSVSADGRTGATTRSS